MRRNIRLNENDISRILRRIIKEEEEKHPIKTRFWQEMTTEIEGDNVSVIRESQNELVIDGINYIYKLTRTRRK